MAQRISLSRVLCLQAFQVNLLLVLGDACASTSQALLSIENTVMKVQAMAWSAAMCVKLAVPMHATDAVLPVYLLLVMAMQMTHDNACCVGRRMHDEVTCRNSMTLKGFPQC